VAIMEWGIYSELRSIIIIIKEEEEKRRISAQSGDERERE